MMMITVANIVNCLLRLLETISKTTFVTAINSPTPGRDDNSATSAAAAGLPGPHENIRPEPTNTSPK